jgi:hypothetical protein
MDKEDIFSLHGPFYSEEFYPPKYYKGNCCPIMRVEERKHWYPSSLYHPREDHHVHTSAKA